jgi:hypothetical protein
MYVPAKTRRTVMFFFCSQDTAATVSHGQPQEIKALEAIGGSGIQAGLTLVGDPRHLQLANSAEVVDEEDDLVLAVMLERDEATVGIRRVDDFAEHVSNEVRSGAEGELGRAGLVVDTHALRGQGDPAQNRHVQ